LGGLTLTDSGFRIDHQGLVARIQVALDANFGKSIGLSFDVTALVSINTTGHSQTLGSSTVDPGFKLDLQGDVEFLGFASASGFVDITINSNQFQLLFGLQFNI